VPSALPSEQHSALNISRYMRSIIQQLNLILTGTHGLCLCLRYFLLYFVGPELRVTSETITRSCVPSTKVIVLSRCPREIQASPVTVPCVRLSGNNNNNNNNDKDNVYGAIIMCQPVRRYIRIDECRSALTAGPRQSVGRSVLMHTIIVYIIHRYLLLLLRPKAAPILASHEMQTTEAVQ